LTTHTVDDVAEALAVVELYRRRWVIEQLFRTLKTQGFISRDCSSQRKRRCGGW